MEEFPVRKYKQVKRKEVVFDLNEWAEVERRAAAANLKIGTYIKKIAVNGELTYYDMQNAAPLVNAMRTINNNVNQIARKANCLSPPVSAINQHAGRKHRSVAISTASTLHAPTGKVKCSSTGRDAPSRPASITGSNESLSKGKNGMPASLRA